MKNAQAPETLALHAGHTPDCATRSRAVPIYQTTSYTFDSVAHAADLFALKTPGYIYTRIMNPTTEVLENRLAAMHGAAGACCASSGMAAIFNAVCTIAATGQNFVTGSNLYGGTHTLFANTLRRFGIEARFVDSSDPANFAKAIDDKTRFLFTESIGNPSCNVDDLAAIAAVAHDHGLPFLVDNTVSPPPLFNPFEHGVDIAIYSLTKMIGGHGTAIGGVVVDSGRFDWTSGRFPELSEPDPAYHGLVFTTTFCDLADGSKACPAFILKLRTSMLRDVGACIAPINSFLVLQGVETLPMRARTHTANAQKVAEFLEKHPAVSWVRYAGLPSHPDFERAGRYFPLGPGAVFGFGLSGGREAGVRFIESVKLCSHLANILDAKTLVIHPASTTHSQLNEAELAKAGVPADMIRISVGLENVDDILADLDQALTA